MLSKMPKHRTFSVLMTLLLMQKITVWRQIIVNLL